MKPAAHTILQCRDEDGALFDGQYTSIAAITDSADAMLPDTQGGMNQLRWFRKRQHGWEVCKQPSSWSYGHGVDELMITNEIERSG